MMSVVRFCRRLPVLSVVFLITVLPVALGAQTPVPIGDPIEVATAMDGGTVLRAAKTLPGVGAVVVWYDAALGQSLYSFYGTTGAPVREDQVLVVGTGEITDVHLEPDGSFLVAWVEAGDMDSVYFLRVEAGGAISSPVLVDTNTGPTDHYGRPHVIAVGASDVLVAWYSNTSPISGTDDDAILGRKLPLPTFGLRSEGRGPERAPSPGVFEISSGAEPRAPDLAQLTDGRIVVAWGQSGVTENQVAFRYFDSTPTALGPPTVLDYPLLGLQAGLGAWVTVEPSTNSEMLLGIAESCDFSDPKALIWRVSNSGSLVNDYTMPMPFSAGPNGPISVSEAPSGEVLLMTEVSQCGRALPGWSNPFNYQRFANDGMPLGSPGQLLDAYVGTFGGLISETRAILAHENGQDVAMRILDQGPAVRLPAPLSVGVGDPITVEVDFDPHDLTVGGVAFSVDYDQTCLSIDPTDADGSGVPDTITDDAITEGLVRTVTFDPADTDGEIDVLIYPDGPSGVHVDPGPVLGMTFDSLCPPSGSDPSLAEVSFSTSPSPSFGNLLGGALDGGSQDGWVAILPGVRGDSNGDGSIEVSDLVTIVLEIFDGDGMVWTDVPGGTTVSDPVGADANGDAVVDSGDVTCVGRLIFGETCTAPGGRSIEGRPSVILPAGGERTGNLLRVAIGLDSAREPVASVAFSLDLEDGTSFDPETGVRSSLPPSWIDVTYDPTDTDGELDILVASPASADPQTLPVGELLELELITPPGVADLSVPADFASEPRVSFGNIFGLGVEGLGITQPLFADGFERGDPGAWSGTSR